MKPKTFNVIDRDIIRALYKEGIPMTIGEISDKTRISWITVKKHIGKLLELDLVEKVETPTRKTPKFVWNFAHYLEMNTLAEMTA